jgi:hypothetical protein
MTALCDLRKILRAAQARQDRSTTSFSGIESFYSVLGRGAQTKSSGYFSLTQCSRFVNQMRRRLWPVKSFVSQMRRENVRVNASRKTFNNIYARFHNLHRMGASQERAVFFNATFLVVTRHRMCVRSTCGPLGRRKMR